jgi:hypothetical protein
LLLLHSPILFIFKIGSDDDEMFLDDDGSCENNNIKFEGQILKTDNDENKNVQEQKHKQQNLMTSPQSIKKQEIILHPLASPLDIDEYSEDNNTILFKNTMINENKYKLPCNYNCFCTYCFFFVARDGGQFFFFLILKIVIGTK